MLGPPTPGSTTGPGVIHYHCSADRHELEGPQQLEVYIHSTSAGQYQKYVTGFAKRDLFFDNFKKIRLGSQTSTPTNALYCFQKLNRYEHCVMRYKLHKTVHTQLIQSNRVYMVKTTVKVLISVDTSGDSGDH